MTRRPPTPGGDASRGLLEARRAAIAVVGLGVVALVGAAQVRPGAGYVAVGPSVMPAVVGLGLVALGFLLLLRATVRPDLELARHVSAEAAASEWRTPGLTLGALVVYAATLGWAGYVMATSIVLPVAAAILGSRQPVRDVVVAIALSIVVFFGFTEFLGVRLPSGLLESVLP